MTRIKNKNQLIRNGQGRLSRKARKMALQSLEAALNAVDPYKILKSRISIKDSIMAVDGYSFDLRKFKRVYVIGGGKASGRMADALSRALDGKIARGIVNVPHGGERTIGTIELRGASHPTPDEAGVKGTSQMLEIAEEAGENDFVICLISGGGSSLMPLPRDGISILDKRRITTALLRSGATVNEINTLRKHISHFKGGWLAKETFPATILNLILSDVVGDSLGFIASGPTVPDPTTFSNAISVLRKYRLWDAAPITIKKVLVNGTKRLIPETPKPGDKAFKKVYNVVIGSNRSASAAAREYLKSIGLNSLMLTSSLEGEARDVGVILASVACEIVESGNPIPRAAGIVAGGETTVTVTGHGKGGRNQEIALAATPKLSGRGGVVLACLSTDGADGPTNAAGAIADGETLAKATRMGLSPEGYLIENDSYTFFSKLGDLILTGPTGTNVNDISVLVVL